MIPLVSVPEPTLLEKSMNMPIVRKILDKGLSDQRFGWWSTALSVMVSYPFGGGTVCLSHLAQDWHTIHG